VPACPGARASVDTVLIGVRDVLPPLSLFLVSWLQAEPTIFSGREGPHSRPRHDFRPAVSFQTLHPRLAPCVAVAVYRPWAGCPLYLYFSGKWDIKCRLKKKKKKEGMDALAVKSRLRRIAKGM
jgi:hypothetical protein